MGIEFDGGGGLIRGNKLGEVLMGKLFLQYGFLSEKINQVELWYMLKLN